jgi:hypothetical protein
MNQCKQGKKREKSENKKQQSKAVDLGVQNRFVVDYKFIMSDLYIPISQ